jgi:riboflavin synthase
MFTGIIETLGTVTAIESNGTNKSFQIESSITHELKIDQSVAHNGVCLTVVNINGNKYTVTAIDETLKRTNLGLLTVGDKINLERCLPANGRLDGHFVQGHVDLTAICTEVKDENGSWVFKFEYDKSSDQYTVQKGSVCVNGVSLTVVESETGMFSVAIIPYTYEHTNFNSFKVGSKVNIEFDILGKYMIAYMKRMEKK